MQTRAVSISMRRLEGSLDLPSLPEPALTLRDLDRAIQIARARPPEVDFQPLDPGSYGIGLPGGERDPGYDRCRASSSFHQTTSSCSLLAATRSARSAWMAPAEAPKAAGIAWMVQRPGTEAEFVVATQFGPRTVGSFEETAGGA